MGTATSTQMSPAEEFEQGMLQYQNRFPFNNDLVRKYCYTYQLSAEEVYHLYQNFCKMDDDNFGYIEIDNLLDFIQETRQSIVFPYLKGLFEIVDKEEDSRLDFFEWMTLIIEYCLMTEEQLKKLIFRIVDHNNDEMVSKKEILTFFSQDSEVTGKKIFPVNYLKQIVNMPVERADQILIQDFSKAIQFVPLIIYPAVRLQQDLRQKIQGESFWENISKKLREFESKKRREEQIRLFEIEAEKKNKEKAEKKARILKQF